MHRSTNTKHERLLHLAISFFILFASCKKQTEPPIDECPDITRTIQFSLYTDTDFSKETGKISFIVAIRNARHRTIWDTVLPPMKIKDIPGINNKIFIEKQLSGIDNALLQAGFIYTIQDVGISWFWEQIKPHETLKRVDFNFK